MRFSMGPTEELSLLDRVDLSPRLGTRELRFPYQGGDRYRFLEGFLPDYGLLKAIIAGHYDERLVSCIDLPGWEMELPSTTVTFLNYPDGRRQFHLAQAITTGVKERDLWRLLRGDDRTNYATEPDMSVDIWWQPADLSYYSGRVTYDDNGRRATIMHEFGHYVGYPGDYTEKGGVFDRMVVEKGGLRYELPYNDPAFYPAGLEGSMSVKRSPFVPGQFTNERWTQKTWLTAVGCEPLVHLSLVGLCKLNERYNGLFPA